MTDDEAEQELARRLLALPGVRGLFPHWPVRVAALVSPNGHRTTPARVRIVPGATTEVLVRVAVDRSTSAADVIEAVQRTVAEHVPGPLHLTVEVARIA